MLLQLVTQELSLNVCFLYILSIVPNEINTWMKKNHSCMRIWISVSTVVHAVGTAKKGPAELGGKSGMGFVFCVDTGERLQPSCFRHSHVFSDDFDTTLSWCTLFIEKIMTSYACIQIFRKWCIFIASFLYFTQDLYCNDVWNSHTQYFLLGKSTMCCSKPAFARIQATAISPWNAGEPGISHSHSYFSSQHSIVRT